MNALTSGDCTLSANCNAMPLQPLVNSEAMIELFIGEKETNTVIFVLIQKQGYNLRFVTIRTSVEARILCVTTATKKMSRDRGLN